MSGGRRHTATAAHGGPSQAKAHDQQRPTGRFRHRGRCDEIGVDVNRNITGEFTPARVQAAAEITKVGAESQAIAVDRGQLAIDEARTARIAPSNADFTGTNAEINREQRVSDRTKAKSVGDAARLILSLRAVVEIRDEAEFDVGRTEEVFTSDDIREEALEARIAPSIIIDIVAFAGEPVRAPNGGVLPLLPPVVERVP